MCVCVCVRVLEGPSGHIGLGGRGCDSAPRPVLGGVCGVVCRTLPLRTTVAFFSPRCPRRPSATSGSRRFVGQNLCAPWASRPLCVPSPWLLASVGSADATSRRRFVERLLPCVVRLSVTSNSWSTGCSSWMVLCTSRLARVWDDVAACVRTCGNAPMGHAYAGGVTTAPRPAGGSSSEEFGSRRTDFSPVGEKRTQLGDNDRVPLLLAAVV